MIISRTPFRVSLFGGGTDYPAWYKDNGGAVVGFSINRYCYITLRQLPPFFDYRHRIVYSQIETVQETGDIKHPAVRAVLTELDVKEGLEIHHDGDLPARSGLGSSSSFTVGLIHALNALRGQMSSKHSLASEALRIEQQVLKENVGSQDQIWAAHGGFNRIDFSQHGFWVSPLIVPDARMREILDHAVLFFTGFQRFSSDVAKHKLDNIGRNRAHLERMRDMVDEAVAMITNAACPIEELGKLLDDGWKLKRDLSSAVSNDAIDQIYNAGKAAGAMGGKLLGAGGGGFFLFFVSPERRAALREALRGLIEVDIDVDRDGSRIVLFEPDGFQRSPLKSRLLPVAA